MNNLEKCILKSGERECKYKNMLYIVVGPSGSGKSTFIKIALKSSCIKVIPVDVYSTSMREYEENLGRNRISKSDFEKKCLKNDYSATCEYFDSKYGFFIPPDYDNKNIIYLLDYPGDYPECLDIKRFSWQGILILPPSIKILKKRLTICNRSDRIKSAEQEYYECLLDIKNKKLNYLWTIIINNDFSDLYKKVNEIF